MRAVSLFEDASGTVMLYRGDSTAIDRFEFSKTDHAALFGVGFYLTDNPEVARDYTASKGEDSLVFRRGSGGDDGAHTANDLVRAYLRDLVINDGLDERLHELRTEWQNKFYLEFRTHESRTKETTAPFHKQYEEVRSKVIRDYVAKAKKTFERDRRKMRITRLTTGEYVFTAAGRAGRVTQFDVPKSYLARCLHAERPLPDDVLPVLKKAFARASYDGGGEETKWDLRVLTPDGDETGMKTFDEFVEGYRKLGARYAWTERRLGGDGSNPTLDVLMNGTHSGISIFSQQKYQLPLIHDLQAMGYVGIAYDGGVRLAGTMARGGGGIRHNAYVLWNEEDVNGFRVGAEGVTDDDIGDLHKGMRADKVWRP